MDSTAIFRQGAIWQAQIIWLHSGSLMVDPEVDAVVEESTRSVTRLTIRAILRWDLPWSQYELLPYGNVYLALRTTPNDVSGIQAVCYRFWQET